MPMITEATVRVQCQADHPDPSKHGQRCLRVLGDIPSSWQFVGTAVKRPPLNGKIHMQCTRRDCRTWNIFDGPHE